MKFPSLSTIVFCVLAGVCASRVAADEPPKAVHKTITAAGAAPDRVLQIFSMQNIRADAALAIVRDVFVAKGIDPHEQPRFAVDEQQNRLIASGDRETLLHVGALVRKLDEHEIVATRKISVNFDLRYIDPHDAEAGVRQLGIEGVRTVVNRRTKALIANGSQEAIDRVRKLVTSLDVPRSEPRGENIAVRIVWLVDKSLATEKTPPVPGDLDAAISALRTKMEIGELRTATQMMVNVNPVESAPFTVSGTASLLRKAELQLTGVMAGAESNRLNLQFSATEEQGGKPVCRLNTTTGSLVPGNPVIVGMTTVDSHPSLIVIELLPK
jgi:type II secretory pathway component GspD/PulD (secretin)